MDRPSESLPDIGTALAPLLALVPRDRQPLLIALAERLAAARYRTWANEADDDTQRANLRACAEREEEIARRVEAMYPDAGALQRALVADLPGLDDLNRTLFAGRPLADQFAIQARGERLGAATWRAFARHAPGAEARATFETCARLEEDSAAVLESLLSQS